VVLDSMSDTSFIREDLVTRLRLQTGLLHPATVHGVMEKDTEIQTQAVDLHLVPTQKGAETLDLVAWTILTLTGAHNSVNWGREKQTFEHLHDLPIADLPDGVVPDILIGLDNHFVMTAGEAMREGKTQDEPYAERTRFGWVIHGRTEKSTAVMKRMSCCLTTLTSGDLLWGTIL
jgi:hypothetical protein